MAQTVMDVELGELEGLGPATKEKLAGAGIESVLDLAAALPGELVERAGLTMEKANAMIFVAQHKLTECGLIDKEFITASEELERRAGMVKCTTGSKNLDALLDGGIETRAITEFYGEFGSGKSQICQTLTVTAQQPREANGLGGAVLYIDTEGTFRPERVKQIADGRGLDSAQVLNNIVICKVYNSSHLELVVRSLGRYIEKYGARLIVIDSIISLHRAEFSGRGTLAERQQRLNVLVHRLLRVAEIYDVAVVVTNQVQTQPDSFFGDPTRPAGGNVIAHASTYRIYLKKAGADRIALMIDSPYHPYADTRFQVTSKGIEDAEPKRTTTVAPRA
jgi:DNA repair protein RadA